jgi:hypothetical protein
MPNITNPKCPQAAANPQPDLWEENASNDMAHFWANVLHLKGSSDE